ncbi:unnamed protein product [Polarella glacialis]|uniref:tRNA (guanine(9)-N(1))-methyltransferase n=1 Tax=Polarella glacialis TaxID=89957 RepID=A0A813KWS8_POLGL|nr:unnamed protein product [Polarella glacialis]
MAWGSSFALSQCVVPPVAKLLQLQRLGSKLSSRPSVAPSWSTGRLSPALWLAESNNNKNNNQRNNSNNSRKNSRNSNNSGSSSSPVCGLRGPLCGGGALALLLRRAPRLRREGGRASYCTRRVASCDDLETGIEPDGGSTSSSAKPTTATTAATATAATATTTTTATTATATTATAATTTSATTATATTTAAATTTTTLTDEQVGPFLGRHGEVAQEPYDYKRIRKEKRKRGNERRTDNFRELLASMSEEDSAAYQENWRATRDANKSAVQASLQHAYEHGKPKVVINCSFASKMRKNELTSLASQIQLSYASIKKMQSHVQLHVTSLDSENPATTSLELSGLRGWKVHAHEKPFWELFEPEQLVVLTPDAEEELEEVEEDLVYVIGGLVDMSVQKFRSLDQAKANRVQCFRRLPIKKYAPKGTHPILNIDLVVRILAQRAQQREWPAILTDLLPKRNLREDKRRPARSAQTAGDVSDDGFAQTAGDDADEGFAQTAGDDADEQLTSS